VTTIATDLTWFGNLISRSHNTEREWCRVDGVENIVAQVICACLDHCHPVTRQNIGNRSTYLGYVTIDPRINVLNLILLLLIVSLYQVLNIKHGIS
jgi:hypothetical protein